jgi:hypothetical protein
MASGEQAFHQCALPPIAGSPQHTQSAGSLTRSDPARGERSEPRSPRACLNFGVNGHTISIEGTEIQMKLSFVVSLLIAAGLSAYAQTAMPRMTSCEPQNGKKGDVIAVAGENLTKEVVAKVFLTDGKNDFAVEVTEQTATNIKFKIPEKATGRLALMVLTTGKDAKYIEQPVKVTIDE